MDALIGALGGTRLMPRDPYRFARGEQVVSNTGQPVRLSRPLDFYMIMDHSDAMGVITDIIGGAPNIMADEQGRAFNEAFNAGGETAQKASFERISLFAQGKVSPALNCHPGNPAYARVWDDLVTTAEDFNPDLEPARVLLCPRDRNPDPALDSL